MASVSSASKDLRIVLLGVSGVGKSATGNAILSKEIFKETETTECEIQRGSVDGRNISIIDTPGINNTTLSPDQLKTEVRRCISLSSPGPHVFLLVIRVGRVTEEERNSVKWIQENFGEEALKFTMVLFTGKEDMTNRQLKSFSQDPEMLELTKNCGAGYYIINSKREVNSAQITKLLEKIETDVHKDSRCYYTTEMYEAVQRKKRIEKAREEEKKERDRLRKIQEEEKERLEKEKREKDRKRQEEEKERLEKEKREKDRKRQEEEKERLEKKREEEKREMERKRQEEEKRRRQEKKESEEDKREIANVERKPDREKTHKEEQSTKEVHRELIFTHTIRVSSRENQKEFKRQKSQSETTWEQDGGAVGGVIPDPESVLRIALLGIAGAGKSSSGNTILGREAFGSNYMNVTTRSEKQSGIVGNHLVTLIDTKGILNRADISAYHKLFEECMSLSSPGPHIFLLVADLPNSLNHVLLPLFKHLGQEFLQRTLFLLTHGDIWGRDHRKVLNNNPELRRLVNICGGDYQIFNNKKREDRSQVVELLEKIETLMQRNRGQHYTNDMYQEAQRKRVEKDMKERVSTLEKKVDDLTLKNTKLSDELHQLQSGKSENDGCCLL